MSIQRYRNHGGHGDSNCISSHANGEWVTYDDHLAEVERLRQEWTAGDFIADQGDPYYEVSRRAAEAMRAACIAAVRAAWEKARKNYDDRPMDAEVLAALREVKP